MQCNWQPLCSHAEVAVAAAIKYRNVSLSSQAELSFHYERNQLTQSQIIIWTQLSAMYTLREGERERERA